MVTCSGAGSGTSGVLRELSGDPRKTSGELRQPSILSAVRDLERNGCGLLDCVLKIAEPEPVEHLVEVVADVQRPEFARRRELAVLDVRPRRGVREIEQNEPRRGATGRGRDETPAAGPV